MDHAITDEILEELSSALQRVEAQSSAVLEFVKDKGIVKEDELAPYLERASAASSVRWRATRVRLRRLLSGLEKRQESKEQRKEEGQKSEAEKASEPKSAAKRESEEKPPQQSKIRSSDDNDKQGHPLSQSSLPMLTMTALLEVAIRNRASMSRSREINLPRPRRNRRPIKANRETLPELQVHRSEQGPLLSIPIYAAINGRSSTISINATGLLSLSWRFHTSGPLFCTAQLRLPLPLRFSHVGYPPARLTDDRHSHFGLQNRA
jgi:hypothetical protein